MELEGQQRVLSLPQSQSLTNNDPEANPPSAGGRPESAASTAMPRSELPSLQAQPCGLRKGPPSSESPMGLTAPAPAPESEHASFRIPPRDVSSGSGVLAPTPHQSFAPVQGTPQEPDSLEVGGTWVNPPAGPRHPVRLQLRGPPPLVVRVLGTLTGRWGALIHGLLLVLGGIDTATHETPRRIQCLFQAWSCVLMVCSMLRTALAVWNTWSKWQVGELASRLCRDPRGPRYIAGGAHRCSLGAAAPGLAPAHRPGGPAGQGGLGLSRVGPLYLARGGAVARPAVRIARGCQHRAAWLHLLAGLRAPAAAAPVARADPRRCVDCGGAQHRAICLFPGRLFGAVDGANVHVSEASRKALATLSVVDARSYSRLGPCWLCLAEDLRRHCLQFTAPVCSALLTLGLSATSSGLDMWYPFHARLDNEDRMRYNTSELLYCLLWSCLLLVLVKALVSVNEAARAKFVRPLEQRPGCLHVPEAQEDRGVERAQAMLLLMSSRPLDWFIKDSTSVSLAVYKVLATFILSNGSTRVVAFLAGLKT
mmetsp:Transcript_32835/g.97754  ORF Transcript_32835/g.97754 Transcript_32835/m.97754 type:complete len:537 (+) Transcript_32835:101-1711(+)